MNKYILAGSALAVLGSTAALAQPGETRRAMAEPLTRAAVQSRVEARFTKLDTNRDGFVTQAEAQAAVEARRGKRQANRSERRADLFARLDTNRDGSISRQEFESRPALSREDRAEGRAERGERRGDRMAHRGPRGGRGMITGFRARAFTALDANRDGKVSLVEASNGALSRFDRLDANRDGTISQDERRSARESLRGGRPGN